MSRLAFLLFAVFSGVFCSVASADEWVDGYIRRNGTYVPGHFRSSPDGNFFNNYSTYPNVNPYTGKIGTKRYPNYSSPSYSPPSYENYPPSIQLQSRPYGALNLDRFQVPGTKGYGKNVRIYGW